MVATAAEAGIRLLALTDHDTVSGVDEALASGDAYGIAVVPAVELTAADDGIDDLHVLGYGIDHREPQLLALLRQARRSRVDRIAAMAAGLRAAGFALDHTRLERMQAAGGTIGRPHLAAAVIEHPGNAGRLAREGRADVDAFIAAYLVPGAGAYCPRQAPSVTEAIERIHAAGGLAVWAHPFWDVTTEHEVGARLERYAAAGLDGVEAFYLTHAREQTAFLVECAAAHDLLTTGSSDFHGPGHPRFNRFGAFETFGLAPNLGPIC